MCYYNDTKFECEQVLSANLSTFNCARPGLNQTACYAITTIGEGCYWA